MNRQWQHWTAAELAVLRERYPGDGPEAVGRVLDRSPRSVASKAKELRLRRAPAWTPAMDARLREAYGLVPTRDLAVEFGKTVNATKQRATTLGVSARYDYTPEQIALVRELYQTTPASEIARRLHGRPRAALSIMRLAAKLGLRKWPHHSPETIARFKELHANGLCDRVIAERMSDAFAAGDKGREAVKNVRQRFGLPLNPDVDARRRGVEKQLRTLGLTSVNQLRTRAYCLYAIANGWPVGLRPRSVQVLNVLAVHGPMTRWQIGERIGWNMTRAKKEPRSLLASSDPEGSYTGHLIARGLVMRQKRQVRVQCRDGRYRGRQIASLYMLTATAIAMVQRRIAHANEQRTGTA